MINQFCKAGIQHDRDMKINQDVVLFGTTKRYSVITLADGVSSCKKAREGAMIAGNALQNLLLQKGNYFFNFNKEKRVEFVLSHIMYELRQEAKESGKDMTEYSSTLAGILFDKRSGKMLYMNLGDSMILTVENQKCRILAMPADSTWGCPVTTTKSANCLFQTDVIDAARLDDVIICSDGAWRHMYDKNYMKPKVKDLLVNGEYGELEKFLEQQNCYDDYSFISLSMSK